MLSLSNLQLELKYFYKRGRSLLLLPLFLLSISCSGDLSQYGHVTLNSTSNKDSFIFSVTDQFLKKNSGSKASKKNPKISKAESKLLSFLLRQHNYCLNDYGNPSFIITSRQEKIYDITFAHLIEQNYNARAIAPRTYFGRCSIK